MGKFTTNHNIKKLGDGDWRSVHGHGAAQLVIARLLLCSYGVLPHLFRDAKYDVVVETNRVLFRIEVKSTGMNKDPLYDQQASFSFVSGVRSGKQIDSNAEKREKVVSTNDADFAIGVSSHDGGVWVYPVEIFEIMGSNMKLHYGDQFKEKLGVFDGLTNSTLDSSEIKKGFLSRNISDLELICKNEKISITNKNQEEDFAYPWRKSKRIRTIKLNYQESLVLDIWQYVFSSV